MQIWPAIDLRGGKCVRLEQGDYGKETVFGDDPVAMARHWVNEGADRLHLVDLDGAREGAPRNLKSIRAIVEAVDVPCELGGGVRDENMIGQLLEMGLARLVIGTRALREPEWFRFMCRRFRGKLVLGIDAREGRVATEGWLETSETSAVELARQFDKEPLAAIVYTDIATDGMLAGPNLEAIAEMRAAVSAPVIASGGVTSVDDIVALRRAKADGCIVGKALYVGKLSLKDAMRAATESEEGEGAQT